MIVEITSKGQVTLPARVLDAMGVGPGDRLELEEVPDGFILRPRQIDVSMLGGLKDKIPPNHPPFDIDKFSRERESMDDSVNLGADRSGKGS